MENASKSDKITNAIFVILIVVFSLFCLFPLVFALMGSLTSESEVVLNGFKLWPERLTLDTYRFTFSQKGHELFGAYFMTISVTVLGTAISMVITTCFSFAISMKDFRYANKFALYAYITMIFSGGMLPWYLVLTKYYGLKNSIWALTLPYGMNVFNMYLLRNFFKSIPWELVESSRIDGAGYFTIMARIYLPLSKAGLVTVGLFYALQFWNDFQLPLFLTSDSKYYTVQYILYKLVSDASYMANASSGSLGASHITFPAQTLKMAVTIIAIGPIILLYPMIQKYFVKGVMVGALKG